MVSWRLAALVSSWRSRGRRRRQDREEIRRAVEQGRAIGAATPYIGYAPAPAPQDYQTPRTPAPINERPLMTPLAEERTRQRRGRRWL